MTGVLDEATETWTDLDDMLAEELPPCLFLPMGGGDACGRPSVATVFANCNSCGTHFHAPLCGEHVEHFAAVLRDPDRPKACNFCDKTAVMWGQS